MTETEFFRLIDSNGGHKEVSAAYSEFITTVVAICTGAADPCHPLPALSYAETELQYHKALQDMETGHGMAEMRCINDGEITVGELASFFYSLFNVEAKDCYRIYSDLKLRKNDSRTYFLDRMQEKLNRRMDMDDEKDRARK